MRKGTIEMTFNKQHDKLTMDFEIRKQKNRKRSDRKGVKN